MAVLTSAWREIGGRLLVASALVLGSFALCLLILEVGLRVWDGVPVFSTMNFVGRELDQIHKPGIADAQYDSRLGWVQEPNQSPKGFTTGEYGVRMSSAQIVPLQQGSILVVGDSFAVGSGVLDADSWPALLEQTLGTQVINAAVGGYGFDQSVLRAEMLIPLLKPRILLVQSRPEFGISLTRMSVFGGAPKPFFRIENGSLLLQNQPVPRVASSSRDIGWTRSVLGHSYLVQYVMTRLNLLQWWVAAGMDHNFVMSTEQAIDVSCLLMHRLAQIRDQNGTRVILVLQYAAVDPMNSPLPWQDQLVRFTDCARGGRLEVIDTFDALRSTYHSEDLRPYQKLWQMSDNNKVYGHMSAEGNRLIASLVAQRLSNDHVVAIRPLR